MRNVGLRTLLAAFWGASLAACAQSPAYEVVPELTDGSTQQIDPSTGIDAGSDPMAQSDAGGDLPVRPRPERDAGADAGDGAPLDPDAGGALFADGGELGPGAGMDAQVEPPDTGPSVPTCAGGTTLCGGTCVDLTSNAAHCGGCGTSCGATSCVASVCSKPVPAGCTDKAFGAHSYLFCTTPLNWIDARNACRRAMLDMTVIGDAAENDFVRGAGDVWIGASDIDGENRWRALAPGVQSREDGPLVPYTNWALGQPSNTFYCAGLPAIGEDCLLPGIDKTDEDCALLLADGRWDDNPCPILRSYVCESY